MRLLSLITVLLSIVGALPLGDPGSVAAAAAVALLMFAATVVSVVAANASASATRPRRPDPRRSISPSTFLAQSDPDAPGRNRPRAPGRAAAAA
ncbi:MAG: DUF6412 domain-containing protein [Microbacterium arborescens]